MAVYPVITSGGSELPADFEVISVEVVREANRIPYARIVLGGGDVPSGSFPALDGETLAPGAAIAVAVRDGDTTTALFAGLVLRLALSIDDGAPQLIVECQDKAFRLTKPRRTAVYAETSDGDAIAAILKRAGVTAGDLGPRGATQPALVQYAASDWDFILARAAANGLAVVVSDGTVDLKPLAVDGSPVLSFQVGLDALDALELELDAAGQFPDVGASGWDPSQGAATAPAAAAPLKLAQGDRDPAAAGTSLGLTAETLVHLVPLPGDELTAWASAQLAQARLGLIRGRLATSGSDAVVPMDLIGLSGVGARFDGNALVTGVRHVVEDGGWRSDYRLGLPPEGLFQPADSAAAPAQGLLPPAAGLHVGIVADYADDLSGEFRVRVLLPELAGADGPIWARLAMPEAGSGRGQVFRPDAGDEVVLGFLGDDPRQPVVLGALYGSKNKPPAGFAPSKDNAAKGLQTKHGIAVAFTDQDKPMLVVRTKAGTLTIDDEHETVSLSDGHHNVLTMDKDGVTITSGKDFKVEASGKVSLKGTSIDLN